MTTLETEINTKSKVDWESWLAEGPTKGFSRQHKMSKAACGWIPTTKYQIDDIDEEVEVDSSEANLSWGNFQGADVHTSENGVPGSVNREVHSQVHAWQGEWACREDSDEMPLAVWLGDMGPPPEPLQLDHFRKAPFSSPVQLGLGWGKIRPRAIARLEDVVLEAILRIMQACEGQGVWPLKSSLVITVLLPRPAGRWRPIGPLAWLRKV